MAKSRAYNRDWIDAVTADIKKQIPELLRDATQDAQRKPPEQPLIEQRITSLLTSSDHAQEQSMAMYIWAVVATDFLARAVNDLSVLRGYQTYYDYFTAHRFEAFENQFNAGNGAINDSPN